MPEPEAAPALQSRLQHQFESLQQQHEADNMGMWVFIASEILFFGGLITAYVMYRSSFPQAFAEASRHTELVSGTIMTQLLLGTSLTMTLAIREVQRYNRKRTIYFLIVTFLLGIAFLMTEGLEYYHMWQARLIPGPSFEFGGSSPHRVQLFFYCFVAMTGLHAIHVTIGVSALVVLAILVWRKKAHTNAVEITGLYWHFVDIVWMFLYPLLYLPFRHP